MISTFTILLLISVFSLYRTTKGRILYSDIFWLLISWILIFGIHFVSGVKWKYEVSIESIIYVLASFIGFLIFRYFGLHSRIVSDKEKSIISLNCYKLLEALGWIGVFVFSVDYIRLNGLFGIGKSQYSISFLGSVSSLLIPILLVTGLYEICDAYIEYRKIQLKAVASLAGYSLPCILNSGRESLLYVIIGFVATLYYSINYLNQNDSSNKKKVSIRKIVTIIVSLALIVIVGAVVFNTSFSRFGNNEVNIFLYTHTVPSNIIEEAKQLGPYQSLYYNYISYFGHQLPFIEYVLKNYNGPYMFGMYELNILSRRLPSFLGLDYRLVYSNIDNAFNGSWQTVLGSFIFDFGKILTPFICCFIGLIVGRNRKRFLIYPSIEKATLNSLICVAMFTTIQLGPFYNFLVYGSFIWWYVIFGMKHA